MGMRRSRRVIIFLGDPDFGRRKRCFVAWKRGGEEEEGMRFLVDWEGERRGFGRYT